jgi:hypothetical protein
MRSKFEEVKIVLKVKKAEYVSALVEMPKILPCVNKKLVKPN